tara:strand:+ start:379 stop:19995 length:19617 start_codon:yes stop_codon:yes gene_type:complete
LVEGQVYYAIAGEAAGLESDQIRFGLTLQSAQAGDYITFLTQGSGRQTLLTEVFGGKATAVVETSRFLEGEQVFQGSAIETQTAIGTVSTNTGWQIGPKILKIVDYTGDWIAGEKVTGVISKASGLIDNLSIARGVLNIGSLTKTPGRFIDDVGKPSEIVQKIQDSFFYQNFSYVIQSQTPITEWKTQVLENNHPAGFNMFGQLQLTGGKDVSGRKIGTEFTKQVNINNYSNVNQITSFGAAQPIYTDYNNTEVLFRKKRLTSSEEILTSIVKKLDDISPQFNGIDKQFPITVEGEQVIVQQNQLMITLNGVIQSPGESYQVVGPNLVFSEPPKPASKVNYRILGVTPTPIYRIALYTSGGGTNFGIFPTMGQQVQGVFSDAVATVIDSGLAHIDVINVTGGTFQLNEEIVRGEIFSALIESVELVNTETIFEFGETITNLEGDTAIIEETNVVDGVVNDRLVVSKTSGTAKFETGIFDLKLNEYVYSASSKIAGQITFISPYIDPITSEVVDELIINRGSTFFGLLFERLVSLENPNVILDDISQSSITPTELYNPDERINADFLDFEEVRTTEITYTNLANGTIEVGDRIVSKDVDYGNPVSTFHGIAANRFLDAKRNVANNKQEIIDFAEGAIAVQFEDYYFPSDVITNPWSRFKDAYRLIQKNKAMIAGMAFDDMKTQYPSSSIPSDSKCKRDIEYLIDAISIDMYAGGNRYTRKFCQQYFDANGTFTYVNGQSAETKFAYEKAVERMNAALANQYSGTINAVNSGDSWTAYQDTTITADPSPGDDYGTNGSNTSNTDAANCSDVQSAITTLGNIVDTTLTNGNLGELPDETEGTYSPHQEKCRRDLGYFVDALANDLGSGGNFNIVEFTKKFFDDAGVPLTNGIVGEEAEAVHAFTQAGELSKRAINNLMYWKDLSGIGYNLNDPTTYTGGTAPAHRYDANYDTGNNQDIANCANVKTYIDTLSGIATTAMTAGNLTNINALASITDGTFQDGETIRTIKLAYKDKSTGLFATGDSIKGVTSGATCESIGANSGLKWIFTGAITGTFQANEYITNSTLSVQGAVTQSVIVKKAELSGSKSIYIPAAGYLNAADSYDFNFGTGDFTVSGWFRPAVNVGTQHLFDFRRLSAAEGLNIRFDGQQLKVYNGTTLGISSGNVFANTGEWYHIEVVRSSNVTQAYVNGAQVGSNWTDNNDYAYAPCAVGTSFQQLQGWTGHIDNVYVKKGVADHTSGFTPSNIFDPDAVDMVLGLDGEAPFVVSTTSVYAKYTGQNTSSATAKKVDYDERDIIIEDVDLGRQEYRNCADILDLNAAWIAEEAVGMMKATFSDFTIRGDDPASNFYGGTNTCIRDTKDYILGAMIKDLHEGGNYHTLYTARTYLTASGKLDHIEEEVLQALYTWDKVIDLCNLVLTTTSTDLSGTYTTKLRIPNNFSTPASQAVQDYITQLGTDLLEVVAPKDVRFRDSGVLIWKNRDYIAEETAEYIQNKYQQTINSTTYDFLEMPGYGQPYCERDIKDHILPAVINDLATGGTYQTQAVIDNYLDSNQNILHVEHEINPMLDAIDFARMLCLKAINNLLLSPGEVAAELGAPAQMQDEYYTPLYTTNTAYRDDTIVIDPEGYPQTTRTSNDRYLDAVEMIQTNKHVIAKEVVAIMNDLSKFEGLNIPGGAINCEDDVIDMIDSISHDIQYDCNEKTYDAAALYIEPEDNSLKHIEGEWEASITVVKILRDVCALTMRNAFGRDYHDGGEPDIKPVQTYEQNPRETVYKLCGDAIDGNIRYIAEQAVAAGTKQFPSLNIPGGPINCVHDVTDILRSLVFNLKYGGNNMLQYGTEYYVNSGGNLIHVTSQSTESVWIMNKAKEFAIRAMKDQVITNDAGHSVGQRFYDAVPKPTNQLLISEPAGTGQGAGGGGGITTTMNNIVTREFDFGDTLISTTDSSVGLVPDEDAVFRCITTLPSGTPTDCTLFECGSASSGVWFGIRDNGTYLRLRAGTATQSYAGGASYTSDTGLAMLDLQISSLSTYFDGGDHELVWEIRVGGDIGTGPGRVKLWIDGVPVGEAVTPGLNSVTGLTGGQGMFADANYGGFGMSSTTWPSGEPGAKNVFTVNVGATPKIAYDVSHADYDASTGDLVLNVGHHDFTNNTKIQLKTNSLIFTCTQDDNATNHSYPRSGDPAGNTAVDIIDVGVVPFTATDAAYDPNSGIMTVTVPSHNFADSTTHTASDATYDPNTGILEVTVNNHGFKTGEQVKIHQGSLIFTCSQDNHASKHGYPRTKDPAGDQWLAIEEVTMHTFKVQVGQTAKREYDVSDATYDQATGELKLEVGNHNFVEATQHIATDAEFTAKTGMLKIHCSQHGFGNGDQILIQDGSMTFTCSMDNHYTNHVYPRSTDPASEKWLSVENATEDSFEVNIGESPIKHFTPTGASYNSATGEMTLTIGTHTLSVGTHIKIAGYSLNFTCAMDNYKSIHAYPRVTDPYHNEPMAITAVTADTITVNVGSTPQVNHTPTDGDYDPLTGDMVLHIGNHDLRPITRYPVSNASYNPLTGLMTITSVAHNIGTGDMVKIRPNSLTFTCAMDGNSTEHSYPRLTDPVAGQWLPVTGSTADTFDVNVGMSPSVNYTPSAVSFTPTTGDMVMTLGNNWLRAPETHKHTNAAYDPTTGIMTLTVADHGFANGDRVWIASNSINFNCTLDGGFSEHRYPRASDPAGNRFLTVTNITKDTFDVQVLDVVPSTNQSAHTFIPEQGITPTGATFDTATGIMTITSGTHHLQDGDYIRIADGAVTFRCDEDGQASDHAYPRATDPVSGKWIQVFNTTNTNFSFQVLENVPCTNTTTHVFQSAVSNSIERGNIIKGGEALKVQTNSLTFTCAQDDHATNHTYPRSTGSNFGGNSGADPVYDKAIPIKHVGTTKHTVTTGAYNPSTGVMTLTVPNHGFITHTPMTATDGSYNPATSVMTLKVGNHGLVEGDRIMITDGGVTFRCDKDDNSTTHTYPRSTDPVSGKWLTVSNVTSDYFDVTTGRFFGHNQITSDAVHTFSSGAQGGIWKANDKIKMDPESITFRCAKDNNNTNHAYPRKSDPSHHEWLPISNANQNTFDVQVGRSQDTSVHQFVSAKPSGVERPDGTITLHVGKSSNTTEHTFVSAATGCIQTGGNHIHSFVANNALTPTNAGYNPNTGIMTLTINGHGLIDGDRVMLNDDAIVFRCDEDAQASDHAYPRNTDPSSGQWLPIQNVTANTFDIKVLFDVPSTNVTTHVFQSAASNSVNVFAVWREGDSIRIDDDSLIFTCGMDGHSTNHTYPRGSGSNYSGDIATTAGADPYFQNSIKIQDVTRVRKTATNVAYTPDTGVMTITLGASHGVSNGDRIKIAPYSISLKCEKDNYATEHKYPRPTDPMFDQWLTVSNAQATTIDVNVGLSGANDRFAHTFHSADANGIHHQSGKIRVHVGKSSNTSEHRFVGVSGLQPVIAGGNYAHAFVSANSGAVHTGGDYIHKFVSATHLTPTNATYNPTTGIMQLTAADHGLVVGSYIKMDEGAVTFTCTQDGDASYHSYPRSSDPMNDTWMKVLAATATTFDVQVLNNTPSTNTTAHTFKSAGRNSVTLASFTKANDTVSLRPDGLVFTCTKDGNATEHSYPRVTDPAYNESLKILDSGISQHTPTGATYTPSTGVLQLTVNNHNFASGDKIMIEDDSLLFTCTMDDNSTAKAYPRGSDPISRQWRDVTIVNSNTISINVGTTANTTKNVLDASYTATTGKLELNIGNHDLKSGQAIKLADNSLTFTCDMDNHGSQHTYPRTTINQWTATGATYNGNSGYMTLTVNNHGLDDGSLIKIDDNALTFRCDFDGNSSDHDYPRASDPISGNWTKIKNTTTNTFDVFVGKSPFVGWDPQDVDYNPTTGVMKVVIGTHNLAVGEKIWLAEESFTFTCAQDNHQTDHKYPRSSDPSFNSPVEITAVEDGSISFNVLSTTPSTNTTAHTFKKSKGMTPTAISYSPASGAMTVTVANHGMVNGEVIKIEDFGLTFTCAKDSHATEHVYPRPTDPFSGRWMEISSVTNDTFVVNVLDDAPSSNTSSHTFVSAKAGCIIRGSIRTGGAYTHSFQSCAANGIKQKRDRVYDHSITIESVGDATYTATAAAYTASTGLLTLTVANNPFSNGDHIKLADNSIIFTCDMDGNATQHSYPRPSDPASGKYLEVSNVSGNDFDVNVGATAAAPYNVSDATYDPTTGEMTLDIGPHPFDSASQHTVENATYNPLTGYMTIHLNDHGFEIGDRVHFAQESISFSCQMDNYITNKAYPRATDPMAERWQEVENVTQHTFDVYVGSDPLETFNVTAATYNPTSGDLVLTIGDHHLTVGESIKLKTESLVFTCDFNGDGNTTQKAYPRATGSSAVGNNGADYVYNTAITITAVTANTITLNVNGGQGAITDTTAHNFVLTAASTGAVIAGGYHPHTFSSAVANGLYRSHQSVYLVADGLSFKCNQDNFSTTHTYPRAAGVTTSTVTAATYDPTSGHMRLTVTGHGYNNNDWIKIADNSLTFRCQQDSLGSDHTYPRSTDPVSGKWIQIRNVTTNTFDVQVLKDVPSTNVTDHVFQSASANGITHKKDPYYDTALPIKSVTGSTITINIGKSSNTSVHQWAGGVSVGAVTGGGQYTHTFVSAVADGIHWKDSTIVIDVGESQAHSWTPTAVSYDPSNGEMTVTVPGHNIQSGDKLRLASKGFTFQCNQDSYGSDHKYPRPNGYSGATADDPAYDDRVTVASVSGDDFVVNVGTSSNTTAHQWVNTVSNETYTPTSASYNPETGKMNISIPADTKDVSTATYNPTTGVLEMTIGSHTLTTSDKIKLKPNSLSFTCDYLGDGNATVKTYPRANGAETSTGADYAYDTVLDITAVSGTTITVNVNGGQGAVTDTSAHTWSGGTSTGAVIVANDFANGDFIKIVDGTFVFTCDKDNNSTNHAYPRSTDPSSGRWLEISNWNGDTFDVQVLDVVPSTNTTAHTFVSISGSNGVSRSMITSGGNYSHTFVSASAGAVKVGGDFTHTFDSAKTGCLHRQNGWITLDVKAAASADQYAHTFVRAVAGALIGGGNYSHTFVSAATNGIEKANEYIYIDEGSIHMTCDRDDNTSIHAYPRATDFAGDEWLAVHNTTSTTFDVMIGKSSDKTKHHFVAADLHGIKKQDGTITVNVGIGGVGNRFAHTFVSAISGAVIKGGDYRHTWVSGAANAITVVDSGLQLTPTDGFYDPVSGDLTLTVAGHSLTQNDNITLAPGSVVFTCTSDQNATNHAYPRATDFADGRILPVTAVNSWAYPVSTKLSYYRSRLVDYNYTGTEAGNVEGEIASLIQFVTDGIQTPGIVNGRSYTMPICWPVKYTDDVVVRDLSVTYDTAGGGQDANGTWNQTCMESASALSTLTDIFINTIQEAAENQVNYLTASVTKTFPFNSNTNYQAGTCYDCTSTADTLFDIMLHALGGGATNSKRVSNILLFNTQSICGRSFDETVATYPGTNLTIDFAQDVLKAVRYDLVTGGNAGAFKLSQTWFDGEGNFIAFPTVTRSHILFCLTRIREYIKSVMYLHTSDAVWLNYDVYIPTDRFEWNQEAVEFMVDSSLNPIEYALERSTFATEARVTFIPSTDVVNLSNKYEVGKDWNTDPALVLLTPEVEVGFERAEYRVRIEQPNNLRRGDVLSYIPASQTSLTALATQPYYYCLTATAEWFEIGVSPIHDGRFRVFQLDTSNTGQQILAVERRSGITRTTPTYPSDPSVTPIQGGFNAADVIFGGTSDASAEISAITMNAANIRQLFTHFPTSNQSQNNSVYQTFTNGEQVRVVGAVTNTGFVLQAGPIAEDGTSFLKIHTIAGAINQNDVLEGVDSGTTATVGVPSDRFFTNLKMGSFNQGDWFFDRDSSVEGYIAEYANKSGSLTGNSGGRITIDVETIADAWIPGDVIYGSVTSYILDIKGISGTQLQLNQYVHGRNVYELDLGTAIIDTGVNDTFNVGDEVVLLQGTTEKNPGFRATVTKYTNDPDNSIHKLWIGNLVPVGLGAPISEVTNPNNNIGKLVIGSNFPTIYAGVNAYTDTPYSSYAKVVAIEQQGITATIWVEDAVGDFVDNMTLSSDDGWGAAVSSARTLEGRVERYFRGFDGVQTTFDLTVANGEAYFPDPAGHLLAFVNGILQPPGATNAYVAFSDKIQFTEAPVIGSQFVGYYVGKLRQLDDISFEFDSLKSSFNLKRQGLFYSLTLTEGVSSNVIRPENNIIVSLNGIIQEPGIAYEIVGSRIIFAEVPRFGATFVGFSYIGSDADVIAATVVPPIEAGDNLMIEGEEFAREVALIESSNSLITFEYTGSVKGRNADAIASITAGQINNAVLTNPGDGYTSRPNVDVISSSGFDARLKALMGVSRVDVKTSGTGYSMPSVAVDNEVPDDWTPPEGGPINGGFDVLAGEGPDGQQGGGVTPGTIAIVTDPVNVTVNQGQTAAFTVVSTVTNDETMNYQWQKKEYGTQTWSNIIGANQSTYNTGNTVQADDGDEYRVAITASGATPVYSLSAILTVQTGATVISNFSPTMIFDDI